MHKDDASRLFRALGNENSTKIAKILYNKGSQDYQNLMKSITNDKTIFDDALNQLIDVNLVNLVDDYYIINKDLLMELLNFIITPCKCTK